MQSREGHQAPPNVDANAFYEGPGEYWINRIWDVLASRRCVGALLVAIGGLLVAAPLARLPQTLTNRWWISPVRFPGILPLITGLLMATAVLGVALLWRRYELINLPEEEDFPAPDVVAYDVPAAQRERSRWTSMWLPWLGALTMAAGLGLAMGQWFMVQSTLPPGRLVLKANKTAETYTATISGQKPLKVMLPLRATLTNLQLTKNPTATIRFAPPGDKTTPGQPLHPGQPVDIHGLRLTFVGVQHDRRQLRAVLESRRKNTIQGAGIVGQKVKLSLKGSGYTVLKIIANFRDAMGPAVQLESPRYGKFWVFERATTMKSPPKFISPVELVRVESVPEVVMSVVHVEPFWPVAAGGGLFILGWALFFMFPERLIRRISARGKPVYLEWSFNESGAMAEEADEASAGGQA